MTCVFPKWAYLVKIVSVLLIFSIIESEDFSIPWFPITFSAGGPSTFQFNITITDDDDFEGDHSFSISFNGSPLVNMGTIPEATVVITDSSGKPSLYT